MRPALTAAVAVYTGLMAISGGVAVVRRRPRPGWLQAGVWTLLGLLVLQAVVAGISLLAGGGPARPALFVAYLVVAVALLPICGALAQSRASSTRADVGLLVAAVALLVVQWRLVVTWRYGDA